MNFPLSLSFGLVMTLAGYWQLRILACDAKKRKPIRRVWVPIIFSLCLVLGIIPYLLIGASTGEVQGFGDYWSYLLLFCRAVGFGIILVIQNYFSAIMCGFLACGLIYGVLSGGDFQTAKGLFVAMLEWSFPGAPDIVGDIYGVVASLYAFTESCFSINFDLDGDFFNLK